MRFKIANYLFVGNKSDAHAGFAVGSVDGRVSLQISYPLSSEDIESVLLENFTFHICIF